MIEGNLLGTALNLFMVRSPTATRDAAAPACRTSAYFLLCIFFPRNAQITLNDPRDLSHCLFLSTHPCMDPVISWRMSCVCFPRTSGWNETLRQRSVWSPPHVTAFTNLHLCNLMAVPSPEGAHGRCSQIAGSWINVIPCWWPESGG